MNKVLFRFVATLSLVTLDPLAVAAAQDDPTRTGLLPGNTWADAVLLP